MATILCAYSGITFKCEHFPASLHNSECAHPVFLLPQHKLLSYTTKWASGELTSTDSYLLFLALMNSTELIQWRNPIRYQSGITDSLVAGNMEALIRIIGKVNLIHHPKFALPSFAVTRDTCTLENVQHWIEAWHEAFLSFMRGYREQTEQERIVRREYALERMIKTTQIKNAKAYARALSDWAELAGNFPTFQIQHPINRQHITLSSYWKEIIVACVNQEQIFQYSKRTDDTDGQDDLQELIEHCEDNIPHGSISAAALMELLRSGKKSQSSYICLNDFDLSAYKAGTLSSEDVVETANKIAMIQSAPLVEPIRSAYNSEIEFVRAKMKWKLKEKYGDIGILDTSTPVDSTPISTPIDTSSEY